MTPAVSLPFFCRVKIASRASSLPPVLRRTNIPQHAARIIVPTLCVGTPLLTLCVKKDAERPGLHSHAERGYDQKP
jgi:hypothetical protein